MRHYENIHPILSYVRSNQLAEIAAASEHTHMHAILECRKWVAITPIRRSVEYGAVRRGTAAASEQPPKRAMGRLDVALHGRLSASSLAPSGRWGRLEALVVHGCASLPRWATACRPEGGRLRGLPVLASRRSLVCFTFWSKMVNQKPVQENWYAWSWRLQDFDKKKSNENGQGEEKLSPVLFRKITAVYRGDCVWDTLNKPASLLHMDLQIWQERQ